MNKLGNLELKVVRFGNEDVIATSGYFINSASFTGATYSEPYVHFYGEMGPYDDDAKGWLIYGANSDSGVSTEYINGYINDIQTANPSTSYALGNSLYDAYAYDGNYYTKGASYYDLYGNSGY